ncbi:MAG: hypothetical protein Q4B78_05500, partial [Bacillota bacterium]|nr:hypothetical protein [Bacillota bacterium]
SKDRLEARVSNGQEWIPYFAFVAQVICLIMTVFESVLIFSIAAGAIIIPMIVYQICKRMGVLRDRDQVEANQGTPFDELFPPQNK